LRPYFLIDVIIALVIPTAVKSDKAINPRNISFIEISFSSETYRIEIDNCSALKIKKEFCRIILGSAVRAEPFYSSV